MISIVTWLWRNPEVHPKKQIHFTADHVNRLNNMLKRNIRDGFRYEFCCITNIPDGIADDVRIIPLWGDFAEMGGCYKRLKLFNSPTAVGIGSHILSIDLDCVVTGDITDLLRQCYDRDFIAWGDTHPKTYYNGSMWGVKAGSNQMVWDTFVKDKERVLRQALAKSHVGTDQAVMSVCFGESKAKWGKKDGIYSFNLHIYRPAMKVRGVPSTLPHNAKIVFFHGRHDPSHKRLYEKFPWIPHHWC